MASIEEKTITLSGGAPVRIRTALPADARDLREFQRMLFAESEYMIHRPEEYRRSVRDERRLLKAKLDSPRELYLLAESDGRLAGLLTSRVDPRRRVRHTIQIGLAVDREYRGRRLGEALMRVFIRWAEGMRGLKRIELNVTEGNVPAIRLYRKLGFREEGRRRQAIRLDSGQYCDDIIMCRRLDRPPEPLAEAALAGEEAESGA